MGLNLITAPASEPLTLSEAKAHLRVDLSADDTYITTLITVARHWAENVTRRALVTQTWDYFLDGFPAWTLELPLPPLQSVGSVKYLDTDEARQTLAASKYVVDATSRRGRLTPAVGEVWPSVSSQMNAVEVRFTAGYGAAAAVPDKIKQAMLVLIGHFYENREAVVVGQTVAKVPMAATWLIDDYRSRRF